MVVSTPWMNIKHPESKSQLTVYARDDISRSDAPSLLRRYITMQRLTGEVWRNWMSMGKTVDEFRDDWYKPEYQRNYVISLVPVEGYYPFEIFQEGAIFHIGNRIVTLWEEP